MFCLFLGSVKSMEKKMVSDSDVKGSSTQDISAEEKQVPCDENDELIMKSLWLVVGATSLIKFLTVPAYRSTDFEVHRNWLAITNSLPISEWYYEDTSEWTLDYPPLFAWFECILSFFAYYCDPRMLIVSNVNYASSATVLFQKFSVITTDLVLAYAVSECVTITSVMHNSSKKDAGLMENSKFTLIVLLLANFGLFVVDHIHFQYNGFLFGVMLLSLARILQGRNLEAAFWFAVLLNLKHIYAYTAPAYFIYLLKHHCFKKVSLAGRVVLASFTPSHFLQLGIVVTSVFAISFGPFIVIGQLGQVLSRLFPFKRGLCHAYWAPNFWALYNIADKALAKIGSCFGNIRVKSGQSSMTGGLVQEYEHSVLPSVSPLATLICTVVLMLPMMLRVWARPSGKTTFIKCVVMCAFVSFLFGWHVHEKAVLLIIVPMSLLAVQSRRDAKIFLLMSTVGCYSLFPLIYTQAETVVKISLLLFSALFSFASLSKVHCCQRKKFCLPFLGIWETMYIFGLVALEVYCSILHQAVGLSKSLPFLPLMITSSYCAIGVFYSWIQFCSLSLLE